MNTLEIAWILSVVFQDNSEQEAIRKLKREQCRAWLQAQKQETNHD